MSETVYLIEPPVRPDDMCDLGEFLRGRGYNLSITGRSLVAFGDIHEGILAHGITHYLNAIVATEAFIPMNSSVSSVAHIIKQYVEKLDSKKTLTIIDPYIFPHKPDDGYTDSLIHIFNKHLKSCKELRFVTKKDHNKKIRQQIAAQIRQINSGIKISVVFTNDIHDRFWIVDDNAGLYVGTSLNGIGKKYTLIDYLKEDDVADIVGILQQLKEQNQ